ncbi:MAG TPA: bifunctional metallophosphatase/5'-nucleotidase [Candidatus Limnocylindrales bacterium]|nr:bifunctional metallophosphatase/5'-nucleotidase [Candidatus Limnocylindrales bacterium]
MTQRPIAAARGRVGALIAALTLVAVLVPVAVAKPPAGGPAEQNAKTTSIQILGLNDFHGQLEAFPAAASSGNRIGALTAGVCTAPTCYPAGGVEYLATHVRSLQATNPNTVFVSAGDLIGATPLLSALFHDEPSIEAFNMMDLDYNGVGNHEFDEGIDELLRMQYGGCHPVDGCGDGDGFDGADFQFLAANVAYEDSGDTIFPPFAIEHFNGVKVAFIGMTLEGTPLIVSPAGISTVDFLDEAETVNNLVPILKGQGVETIVVLLHEGGSPSNTGTTTPETSIDSCVNPSGALPPIVAAMDDEVDVVITGHTNWAVNCVIDGKVVTGAASQGRLITDIDLTISRATKDVIPSMTTVNNVIVTRDVAPAADMTALIAEYNVFAGPIAAEVVGHITGPLTRTANAAGESTMGRLIADAQLASTQADAQPGQIAFMNPGGMRADLAFTAPGPEPVTHGEAFAVQPFSNVVTTKTYTGAQIKTILEQQFVTSANAPRTLVLPVSAGFTYTWTASAPIGSKVSNMMLNGNPILPGSSYRVTANNFLAGGGDDFPGFTVGTNEQVGLDDLVALEAYLDVNDPYTPSVSPPAPVRITRVP